MKLNKNEFIHTFEISDIELDNLIAKNILKTDKDSHLNLYDTENFKWILENKMQILFFARMREAGIF